MPSAAVLALILLTGAMPNKLMRSLQKAGKKAAAEQKAEQPPAKKPTKKDTKKPEPIAAPPPVAPAVEPASEPAAEPPIEETREPEGPRPDPSAASLPTVDPETSVKLRALEERVNELKEKIFRSKARLMVLQEAVLHGTITGARAVLVHKNDMSGSFRLEQVQYSLDGSPIYTYQESESADPKGQRDTFSDEFEIFNGSIVPGSHQISVYLVYRGNGYGVFTYLSQLRFPIKSSFTFTAEEGKQTTVKIVGFEKGGLATELKDRPAVRYDVEVSKELRAPKAPPPAPKGK